MNEISGQTNVRSARFGAGASEGLGRELGRFLVTTMEVPWGLVKERLGVDPAQVLMVENMQIETIERQLEKVGEVDAVLGIGGGQAIDLGKYIAWKRQLPLVTLPTVLSVDTFVTPQPVFAEGTGWITWAKAARIRWSLTTMCCALHRPN